MPTKTESRKPRIITLTVRRLRTMATKLENGDGWQSDADLLRAWADELNESDARTASLDPSKKPKRRKAVK